MPRIVQRAVLRKNLGRTSIHPHLGPLQMPGTLWLRVMLIQPSSGPSPGPKLNSHGVEKDRGRASQFSEMETDLDRSVLGCKHSGQWLEESSIAMC